MRRLALIVFAVATLPGLAVAQSHGRSYAGPPPHASYGSGQASAGHGSQGYGDQGYRSRGSVYGDPRAYRPPTRYGHGSYGYGHDRGGRYGYSPIRSGEWTRWSSPPGRGYHDVYGYNDDRPPRGSDGGRAHARDCDCGPYRYDR